MAGSESNMWTGCGVLTWDLGGPREEWLGRGWGTGGGEREVGLVPQGCCVSASSLEVRVPRGALSQGAT